MISYEWNSYHWNVHEYWTSYFLNEIIRGESVFKKLTLEIEKYLKSYYN